MVGNTHLYFYFNSGFRDRVLPAGTVGTVVEFYENSTDGYTVDLAIPDDNLIGGFSYENVILFPEQFEVVNNPVEEVKHKSASQA